MSESDACCKGAAEVADTADLALANPPGRSALSYRLGTHRTLLRRMLAAIPLQTVPGASSPARPLAALDTRAMEDPAIALLDGWSVVADVLTFYQERIANEGFLRTATERRSVIELARAVGYELAPGVAASAYLAFTVEDTTPIASVPHGTRVQSLPGPDQAPQTFETMEDVEVRAAWNQLRPRSRQPQRLAIVSDALRYADPGQTPVAAVYLRGTATNLRAGDTLLVVSKEGRLAIQARRVVPEPMAGRTRIELAGFDPPIANLLPPLAAPVPVDDRDFSASVLGSTIREEDLHAHLTLTGSSGADLAKHINQRLAAPAATAQVFAFRQRVSCFGHNAPTLTDDTAPPAPTVPSNFGPPQSMQWARAFTDAWDRLREAVVGQRLIWTNSAGAAWAPGVNICLEQPVPEVVPGGWIVLQDPATGVSSAQIKSVAELSIADYSLSAKVTGLGLVSPETTRAFHLRTTTALVRSEPLELVELPLTDPIAAHSLTLALDGFVLGLHAGQAVLISGESLELAGVTISEIAFLSAVIHDHGYTTLVFRQGLRASYVRSTVTINANIATATHGETVAREVLGSGDAAQANQRFVLKKPHLAYLSAPTSTGVQSTVSLRVNDLSWREVPSLFEQDPSAEVYTLSTDDEGRTTVIFGDGQSGTRLPSGRENVVASYRSAVLSQGAVDAGTLTLLKTRPLGIRSVTNPLPATGADGPDALEEGRVNAPITALTLDRVVTLKDYEDFARAFVGIGKAKATALWHGRAQAVHISTVTDRGTSTDRDSAVFRNLNRALLAASDFGQEVLLDGAEVHTFTIGAGLVIDPRRVSTEVLSRAQAALQEAFSLARRDLGQDVHPSEVIAVLQRVPGVIAALLNRLAIVGQPEPTELSTLRALPARVVSGSVRPAALLLIAPIGSVLTEVSA